jgi:hypothetical protein
MGKTKMKSERRRIQKRISLQGIGMLVLFMCVASMTLLRAYAQNKREIIWEGTAIVDDPPNYKDLGPDARHLHAGNFGDDYPRAVKLIDGSWLLVFTSYTAGDSGYLLNPKGGNILVIERSRDNCRTWTRVTTLSDPGRDMDNGEMIQLPNGNILLAARSVRWQESYRLPVYRSADNGHTWSLISDIDSNEGRPGQLGRPDKGVYEPHFYQLTPNELGVMYSTEKHVTESPSRSQTLAEKVSTDGGVTWGREIVVAAGGAPDRPGMPVWTRMKNGKFIVVFEACGPEDCMIHSKISSDGINWMTGMGTPIPFERGAPYLLCLADGGLILTANNHHVGISNDSGVTWRQTADAFSGGPEAAFFSSIYQVSAHRILLMTGQQRLQGGRRIAIRTGEVRE